MLLAERLDQLDGIIQKLDSFNTGDLQSYLNAELTCIKNGLNDSIQKMETKLNNKISNDFTDFQDLTSTWIKGEVKTISSTLETRLDNKAQDFLQQFSNNLSTNLTQVIQDEAAKLHEKVDLSLVVEKIKNDEAILQKILNDSINATLQLIQTKYDDIKQGTINNLTSILKDRINLQEVVKLVLESKELKTIITTEIATQTKESIKNFINDDADEIKERLENEIQNLQNSFRQYLEAEKNVTHENIANLLLEVEKHFQDATNIADNKKDGIIEKYKNAMQEALHAYEAYLNANKDEAIKNIIDTITQAIAENEVSRDSILESITLKGFEYLKEYDEALKQAVISLAVEHFLNTYSNDELKNAILNDKALVSFIDVNSKEAIKERLSHAVLKDFVKEVLKNHAKEVLKNDELLRAEAEAQAHLVAMRLQSNLATLQDCFKALEVKYDIDQEMAILIEKQKQFQTALQQAKDELKNELKNVAMSDVVRNHINNSFLIFTQEQDKKLDALKNDLQTLMQDMHNANTQGFDTKITDLQTQIDNLKIKIDNTGNAGNTGNVNKGNNKYLTWG